MLVHNFFLIYGAGAIVWFTLMYLKPVWLIGPETHKIIIASFASLARKKGIVIATLVDIVANAIVAISWPWSLLCFISRHWYGAAK